MSKCKLRRWGTTFKYRAIPGIAFALALVLSAAMPGPAQAIDRHCDAVYTWETTGGSIKQTFLNFKFAGRGECGSTVPNRCRIRARNAVERCVETHWQKRWDRVVPEACLQNSSDSTVVGYDLTLRCTRHVNSPKEQCYWFFDGTGTPVAQRRNETIAARGDIKARLEGEVCCAYKNGNYRFPNNRDVHVRLSYRPSGNDNCSGGGVLSSDYQIDCQSVRKQFCRHENLWD